MPRRIAAMTLGLAAIVFLTPGVVPAQTPTAEDMAACNEKAKDEVTTASASPPTEKNGATPARAPTLDDARGGALAGAATIDASSPPPINPKAPSPRRSGDRTETTLAGDSDPQLQGIDEEGEKDPVYVAAYKRCMRQRGF